MLTVDVCYVYIHTRYIGYESQTQTDAVRQQSDDYSRNIEEQTLRWAVLDILKTPPAGFEDVVRNHFFLRQVKRMRHTVTQGVL